MLSKEGFQYHLNNIEHHAKWVEYNKDEPELVDVSQQSVNRSKQLLMNFFEEVKTK